MVVSRRALAEELLNAAEVDSGFQHFLLAEDRGKTVFRLGAKDIENVPVVL
jgi:hypothetical protein